MRREILPFAAILSMLENGIADVCPICGEQVELIDDKTYDDYSSSVYACHNTSECPFAVEVLYFGDDMALDLQHALVDASDCGEMISVQKNTVHALIARKADEALCNICAQEGPGARDRYVDTLSDEVSDVMGKKASAINNGDVPAQIAFLLDEGYTMEDVRELATNDGLPALPKVEQGGVAVLKGGQE